MDVKFTLKILILAIVAFLVITVWDELLNRFLFDILELDREKTSSWLVVGVISVILLFVLLYIFKIEGHDILGVGEAVDVQLTGQTETIVRGRVVHKRERT
jgi:hypothetical protein